MYFAAMRACAVQWNADTIIEPVLSHALMCGICEACDCSVGVMKAPSVPERADDGISHAQLRGIGTHPDSVALTVSPLARRCWRWRCRVA